MRIIPVIDVKDGKAVHAVAGQRDAYAPVQSCLTRSSGPFELAKAYTRSLGLKEIYLADLDAISGTAPDTDLYGRITGLPVELIVDAGITSPESASGLSACPGLKIILGLESIEGPEVLEAVLGEMGPEKTLFSLDLKSGTALGKLSRWKTASPEGIAEQAIKSGVKKIIVLDLARVGTGKGLATENLCRDIRSHDKGIELLAGGGIQTIEDVRKLASAGVDGVLIATALHHGRITRQDIQALDCV